MALHCPICRKPAAARAAPGTSSPFPFCSERCRLVDLGKWLSEDYRVPEGPDGSAPVDGIPPPGPDDN